MSLDSGTMFYVGTAGNQIQDDHLSDSRVIFFLWDNLTSQAFAAVIFLAGIVSLSIKGFIIKFVIFNAPNRPINVLVLFEQVQYFPNLRALGDYDFILDDNAHMQLRALCGKHGLGRDRCSPL